MSDALNPFWDYYVAILAVVSVVACAVFLKSQSRRRQVAQDGTPEAATTGHVWDGDLAELNNPLPRWWMWLFYITIFFSLGYIVWYPGTALWKGTSGWTSQEQLRLEMQRANERYGPLYARFDGQDVAMVAADPQGRVIGERLFMHHCAQCHGSDARGSRGFPNLADRDWLHGDDPDAIGQSIRDGRHGIMPPMAAAVGSDVDVRNVANYVLSLSGSAHDSLRAALGREKFAVCAACHGADGRGNQALGAPNLTDRIWLYGGGVETIIEAINKGRNGVMPAHRDLLSPQQLHVLTAYVWSLSNQPAVGAVR